MSLSRAPIRSWGSLPTQKVGPPGSPGCQAHRSATGGRSVWRTRCGRTPRTPSKSSPVGMGACRPPWASLGTRGGSSREHRLRAPGTVGSSSCSSAPAHSARDSR
eukprot:10594316-Alexandrium_andersonii.AAC.1